MKTFEDKVNAIADIKDVYAFAEALEEYALEGISCSTSKLQEMAKKALQEKMKDYLLADFGQLAYAPGTENYYIRSGGDTLIPYVYSKLMDLSCFGTYDLGHVLTIAVQMKKDYEPSDSKNIDGDTIREIMTWMDRKYKYSTRISGLVPMFLIMDRAPVRESSDFLREGCEVTSYAFVFWKTRKNTLISASHETSFLLRLSDGIVKEAWLMAEQDYLKVIGDELSFLGYDRISKMNTRQAHKLLGDLVCIGIAVDSPFQRYIPFLGQRKEYLDATERIADKLLAIIEEKRGF